ncbi:GPO family capsid scaffolding protein [Endozoicomonas sp. YOMI1]|uniref:GPO family capsid scaffolding protein n=1 Tax=Endozoicomonas sp. YOMI1 TaxID=2828739 RepID=UPI0021496E0D|nr:GPO family capsid scaffolding protein [Endozoicomonas sp. YOMI1]
MAKLVTDWVKVAESGQTIDGRIIEASWLRDAAELYSKDKYTALITLEHYSPEWAGNYGTVEALKAEEADEVVSLYAKLCPSDDLRYINKQGQKLFTSIKLHPDFQSTGRAYVIQIGVTDTPASIGTQQLEFRVQAGEQIVPGVELTAFNAAPDEQGLLEKIKALVFSAPHQTDSEDEDEPMKPEELKAAIAEAVAGAFASQQKETSEPEVKDDGDALELVSAEAFSTLKTEADKTKADLEAMTEKFNALSEKFNALEEKLAEEVQPTEIDNQGAQDDAGCDL